LRRRTGRSKPRSRQRSRGFGHSNIGGSIGRPIEEVDVVHGEHIIGVTMPTALFVRADEVIE
jgi:hypothetical protein